MGLLLCYYFSKDSTNVAFSNDDRLRGTSNIEFFPVELRLLFVVNTFQASDRETLRGIRTE